MIRDFKSRALRKLFSDGDTRSVETALIPRLLRRLDALNAAADVSDLNLPGFELHQLKGDRRGTWSIKVSGNWRVTFTFKDGEAFDVDLEDYH
jgi:proteic killer suppression protein